MENEELGDIFSYFGEVEDSYIIRSNQSQKYKSSARKYGFVIFCREEDASKAIKAKKVVHKSVKFIIMPYEKKSGAQGSKVNPNSELSTPNFSPLEPERAQFAPLAQGTHANG